MNGNDFMTKLKICKCGYTGPLELHKTLRASIHATICSDTANAILTNLIQFQGSLAVFIDIYKASDRRKRKVIN